MSRLKGVPRSLALGLIGLWSSGVLVPSKIHAEHLIRSDAAQVVPQGSIQDRPIYDPNTEATVSGTVTELNSSPGRLAWLMRLHTFGLGHGRPKDSELLLKTDDDTVIVHLGPASFLNDQKVQIDEGDRLTVTGSRVLAGGVRMVLAREIRKGDAAWTFRDSTGRALWSTTQAETKRVWTTTKVVLVAVAVKVALLATVLRH